MASPPEGAPAGAAVSRAASESGKAAEVLRILDRYLIEVVERYDLCPWARAARLGGEVAAGVLWGAPSEDAWVDAASALLARPGARVVMVVAPELAITPSALRAIRSRIVVRLPHAGIADFHPQATLDLATPARLVPFLRRAPDPLLQLVPLSLLATVRGPPQTVDLARQVLLLGGLGPPPRPDAAARIAAANHATTTLHAAEIEAALDAIAADRAAAYARAGIGTVGASGAGEGDGPDRPDRSVAAGELGG